MRIYRYVCVRVCLYIYICNMYVYIYLYVCVYLYVYRGIESLSVHHLPPLPTPHGTKSSCGRLDKSIWHGSLHHCSLNRVEHRTDAGRNLHLEYRHLGACLT